MSAHVTPDPEARMGHRLVIDQADAHSRSLRTEHVSALIDELDWHGIGPAAVSCWTIEHRPRDPGPYTFLDVHVGARQLQISVSPTGRSVRVFVDGREVSGP